MGVPQYKESSMKDYKETAYKLLKDWRGSNYIFGLDCLDKVGTLTASCGKKAMVVANHSSMPYVNQVIIPSLRAAGVEIASDTVCPGARPNAPLEDVYRITDFAKKYKIDSIVAVGGGSTIDCCKAVATLYSLNTDTIDKYYGAGKVSEALSEAQVQMLPIIAVQTSASSGAHLTKYANVTDMSAAQKKLIVDPAVVPARALFDYKVTTTMPKDVTIDGALDAISHCFEVFCGASDQTFDKTKEIAECALHLVLSNTKLAIDQPDDLSAREALGLATDLGGYAIMVGGTSGGHLTSFSLVDVTGHGTACGIMNPYYAIFYSPAIQKQLKIVAQILADHGLLPTSSTTMQGHALAESVAAAMLAFNKSIGAPTKLTDIPAFNPQIHISKALTAAKDPTLKTKLQNMPISLSPADVDTYMSPILHAAAFGDFSLIKQM